MSWFVTSLRENPELAIFLTLAIGFVIGRYLAVWEFVFISTPLSTVYKMDRLD